MIREERPERQITAQCADCVCISRKSRCLTSRAVRLSPLPQASAVRLSPLPQASA